MVDGCFIGTRSETGSGQLTRIVDHSAMGIIESMKSTVTSYGCWDCLR